MQNQFDAMTRNGPMICELSGYNNRCTALSEMPEQCSLLEAPEKGEVLELDGTELGRNSVSDSSV
jgi:hypothetical protein